MIFFLLIWSILSLGFLALALAMEKHQKQLLSQALCPSLTRLVQCGGYLCLVLALSLCIAHYHIANGISYWVGAMTFSAFFILMMLSYFTHLFKITLLLSLLIITTGLYFIF